MDEEVFRINANRTATRQIGDESVVLDLNRSLYFGLNRTGGALWQQLLVGASHAELIGRLSAESNGAATAEQINADVDDFLAALRREGLVDEFRTQPR